MVKIRVIASKTIKKIGVDDAIFWMLLGKMFSILRGPVSIIFMIRYLTVSYQGLWYTFLSLGALSVLAELGFSAIITQFVSHEFAHLKEKDEIIEGNEIQIDRFWALIYFAIKFYVILIPIVIISLCIAGYFFFQKKFDTILLAWCIYCMVGGINLFVSLLQSIYQGLDKVSTIQKNITLLSFVTLIFNCVFLYLGFNIWALVVGSFVAELVTILSLYYTGKKFWIQFINYEVRNMHNFFKELMPLQWRYAITWSSGFFIFSLITPSIYKLIGTELAGQYGLSQTIIGSVNGIAYGWISTKAPKFNMLVSSKREREFFDFFKQSFAQGLIVFLFLSFSILIFIISLSKFININNRFLSFSNLLFLTASNLALYIITALAIYVRSHKIEPFIFFSFIQALFSIGLTLIILPKLGINKFMLLNAVIQWCIILPYMLLLFNRFKIKFLSQDAG